MIRDQLVVRIRDSGLSKCLQLNGNLDLEQAVQRCKAVQEQQQTLNYSHTEPTGAGIPDAIQKCDISS